MESAACRIVDHVNVNINANSSHFHLHTYILRDEINSCVTRASPNQMPTPPPT